MKSMKLTGIGKMEMMEVPTPQVRAHDDVLIKMKTVGVCGSDVQYYVTGKIGSQVVQYPFAVGHEGAGIVEDVGPGVTRVKVGDKIAIDPAMPCWQCDQCKLGRPHTCRNLKYLGCPGQAEGCLSEYIVMPEECCFPVDMTFDQAAISEPLAIGVYAVKQSMDMADASIGILGCGPIGLSVLLPAKAWGAKTIFATDPIEERLSAAASVGATLTANPDKQDVVAALLEKHPEGLDCVFECCGQQSALDNAIDLLKPGGKLMLVGIPEVDRVSFSIDLLRRKEICIQNVRRQVGCVEQTLDMISSGEVNVDFMATHRFDFERTQDAFDMVADYRDGVIKAMIDFE